MEFQGNTSTEDEKITATIQTANLASEVHGSSIQVRVPQGSEPQHFMRIFQGLFHPITNNERCVVLFPRFTH